MDLDLILYALIGFAAQLVDSALGMAFGSLSSGLLLSIGFPAQAISPTIHMTEIFGGGASAMSHWRMGNLDYATLKKLLLPALIGAVLGALLMTRFDNEDLRTFLAIYFIFIGSILLIKTLYPAVIKIINTHRSVLGFFGGFLDAFGGAGWGEIVSSGLLLRGFEVRRVIGSLLIVEFMVAIVVSIVFYNTIGITHWRAIIALSLGAIAAAPLGAWLCKKMPVFWLTLSVAILIIAMGLKILLLPLI